MKRNAVAAWLDDQEKLYVQELAKSQGLTISKLIRKELLRNYNGETEQKLIPDTKPDTEPEETKEPETYTEQKTDYDWSSFETGFDEKKDQGVGDFP